MSHKTTIKTDLTDLSYMKKALDKLGFTYKEAEEGKTISTKGRYGVKEECELVITGNGKVKYQEAIGFQKQADGTYSATGDFYGLKTADGKKSLTKEFLKQEVTAYSKEAELIDRLTAMGFDHGSTVDNGDNIEITMERWV